MSGAIIPLFNKRSFSFLASETVVLFKAVDVSQWREGVIQVRVHANTIDSASNFIRVRAYTTAPTMEDPGLEFVKSGNVGDASFNNSLSAPGLVIAALSANFGGYLKITMESTFSTGDCAADLSADLVLKD